MNCLKSKKDNTPTKKLSEKIKKVEIKARKEAISKREELGLQVSPTAALYDNDEAIKPGEGNWKGFGFDMHPQVTLISLAVLIAFIGLNLMFHKETNSFFNSVMSGITSSSGWFLILATNIFIVAALYFAFSRFGKIRIGGKKAETEFSTAAWYAMLLSAGMGIGLIFWSVGEPMYHYMSPSPMFNGIKGQTAEAAQAAMGVTFFHWGLHPWAVYSIIGLGLAFFTYNRGLPLTVRSIFYPIIGDRIYGFWGNLIDVLSVLATLVGLATSLGLGVQQVNAGLHFLFGIEISVGMQVFLIAAITGLATLSVTAGLEKGVKLLSQWNMWLAGLFMLFIIAVGPTTYIASGFTQSVGYYMMKLPQLSMWAEAFRDTHWQGSWTVFYWAWWISWSPFVGTFIARISKGRTVREFILGVMLVPTLLSFLWMSVFGGSALFLQSSGAADIIGAVKTDVSTAMFAMLGNFPLSSISSFIGIILVTVFFVTSSDSGSLVVDNLVSGGKLDSPKAQRIFWAIMEGVLAAVLLLGGGLKTLQTASVSTGLPFAVVLLFIIYALYIEFSQEHFVESAVKKKVDSVKEEHRMFEAIATASEKGKILKLKSS